MDVYSNQKVSRAKIVLEQTYKVLLEQLLCFGFQACNNHAKYEALIAGMDLALEVGSTNLRERNDP